MKPWYEDLFRFFHDAYQMHFSLQYFIISSLGLIRSCIALQYIKVSIFLCAFNKILPIFIWKLPNLVFPYLFSSTIPDFVVVIWTWQIKVTIPTYYLLTSTLNLWYLFIFTYFYSGQLQNFKGIVLVYL